MGYMMFLFLLLAICCPISLSSKAFFCFSVARFVEERVMGLQGFIF